MKKKILIAVACILAVLGILCGIYLPDSEINNTIDEVQNNISEEIKDIDAEENGQNVDSINAEVTDVIISEEAEEIVRDTIQATEEGEDLSTSEEIESSEEEEQLLEEESLEQDALVEQENIAYEGDSTGDGLSLLGAYQGLTYYSQADSRWASIMYSSIGDSSQTMKSSACGPTSAAMVVSSSKGTILPTTMAELAVSNGYRTASSGTAWSYFSFVADYFDFDEFYTTSNFSTALSYLETDADNDGNSDYYIVVSVGSGLFTTGGHYIVLVAEDNDVLTVYDPYLYSGKFTTASRKTAGAVVSGNSVYVTELAFKTYANAKNYWIFSNDEGEGNPNATISNTSSSENTTSVSYTKYVSTSSSNLNVRSGAGTSYSRITSLAKGTQVTVTKIDGNWSYITSPVTGWVSSSYLSSTAVTSTSTSTSYSTSIGSYYRLKSKTTLYANSSMSGTSYNYLAQTQIKVISHYSASIDYIYVVKTR